MDSQSSVSSKRAGKRKISEINNDEPPQDATSTEDDKLTRLPRPRCQSTNVSGTRRNKRINLQKPVQKPAWPEYFNYLSKLFKALNTVLAFVSSRKHLATTFPVIRTSVESLLNQPLDMNKVAELKALLPDLIKFGYIPQNHLRIHADSRSSKRENSPDYSIPGGPSHIGAITETEEHVLILEFAENSKGKKSENPGFNYSLPLSLTPSALKKLIEKRNARFSQAVDELLCATPDGEDPVSILQGAGLAFIPVNPSGPSPSLSRDLEKGIPEDRPSMDSIILELQEQSCYKEQIVHRKVFEAKEGKFAELEEPLSCAIQEALKTSRNITSLYTHQVAAINALTQGQNVIVSTSTASGKSVIYQVPVLRFLENDPDATAIFIYPTKALAQDQKAALENLIGCCPGLRNIKVQTYDGDTPQEQRAGIRETASVIFTNFDMVHTSVLPHEDLWRRFLKNVRLVAVDELHYYSDLFGSHVAQLMRRFRRVCAAIGNRNIRFVSCSATISNPTQHMKNIFGIEDIVEVTEDGAPSGRKDFLVWNPPLIDPLVSIVGRRSSLSEATALMRFLMKRGVRVILFCKIRKVCELAMKTIRTDLSTEGRIDILDRVMSYRGGYSQKDRRRIEHEAFSGNLLGIIATNALELGVDIGVLDAVIMLGFPVGIANFLQQAGRAGRRARDSLAVLVADPLPIDQHYVIHPEDLFCKPANDLVVDLDSKVLIELHLQCAAHEMPLSMEDDVYFGPLTKELCATCLTRDQDGWYHTYAKYLPFPAKFVALRGAQEDSYTIIDITRIGKSGGQAKILEEVEFSRALFEIYEGGVFIHQGLTFIVKEVSHDDRTARLVRADVNWITSPRDFTNIDAVQTFRIKEIKNSPHRSFYGRVEVTTTVYGFFKVRQNKILDVVDLDTPQWQRETTGLWIDVPSVILELFRRKGINAAEAIHAAQHAFLNRFAMRADLKTECKVPVKEYKTSESRRKRPGRLIFYDLIGKSGGIAARAFDHVFDILQDAQSAVELCECSEGCSECIYSSSCKEGNEVSSKLGAHLILRGILDLRIDEDSIPFQFNTSEDFETVVDAPSVHAIEDVVIEIA